MDNLLEQAEAARIAGNREECLRLKKQYEDEQQNALLKAHNEQVEKIKSQYPVGMYIEGFGYVEAITDGCGIKSGWIAIKIKGQEKTITVQEINKRKRQREESKTVEDYFSKIKYPRTGKALICEYNDGLDYLLVKMEMKQIWTLQQWQDNNWELGSESYKYAYDKAIEEGFTDEEAEEKGREAEQNNIDEYYKEYKDKVLESINYLLSFADMELEEGKQGKYYLVPLTSWNHSADKMAEIISAYGMFEYNGGKELKEAGPYIASEAVIKHLHWLKHCPEIYGDKPYNYMMR